MAKSINLQPGPRKGLNTESMPVVAAAVYNGPPLPIGKAIRGSGPALTPAERAKMESVGWVDGQPIPPNMASLIAEAEAGARQEAAQAALVPPVDPSTPPTVLNIVDVNDLPKEKQNEIQARFAEILQRNTAAATAPQPVSPMVAKVASGTKVDVSQLPPPERPATRSVPDPDHKTSNPDLGKVAVNPKARAAAETIRTSEPLAAATHCPHCQWDLTTTAEPEPDHPDKMAFLASVMGEKPFTKEYEMLGGRLKLTFRALAPKELDACFKQVMVDQDKGDVNTVSDYWEAVNRYRLFTQLQRAHAPGSFDHDLPDGLGAAFNPHATASWEFPEGTVEPLKAVEEYMLANVITTETMMRVATQACGRFNKLVAKLEALVDTRSDFWKATGEQSSL